MSLSTRQRHRALATAYPARDTGGWSITLPLDKRALAKARKLYGKKAKTAKPRPSKTKSRARRSITVDELVARALAKL